MPKRPYGGKWPTVRKRVLVRDGYLCTIQGPGCTTKATCVDHIVSTLQGGAWWDEDNLRASCFTCNNRRVHHGTSMRWMGAVTYITLVTGPPSANLLRYVLTHCQPTDLVIDHASLTKSLGSTTAANHAYAALLSQLRNGKVREPRAWLTSHLPNAVATLPHHRVVTLEGTTSMGAGVQVVDARNDVRSGSVPALAASRAW